MNQKNKLKTVFSHFKNTFFVNYVLLQKNKN